MTVRPEHLVAAAGPLLRPAPDTAADNPAALAPGPRARAAAVLLRIALEQALDAYWQRVTPSMTRIGKHRMLCLEWYAGRDTARRCRTTWAALSAACHYGGYELCPAPAEIGVRLREVSELLTLLGPSPGGVPAPRAAPAARR